MELYIKELKLYLTADRTSCNKFSANQFRLFLHAAAYVLLHGIKLEVFKNTHLSNVSILTFRQKILLSAVHIKRDENKNKNRVPYSTSVSKRDKSGSGAISPLAGGRLTPATLSL